jgi:hypothetical protein
MKIKSELQRPRLDSGHWFYIQLTVGPQTSRGSAVGIATGYILDDRWVTVRVLIGSRMFTAASHQDLYWDPLTFLHNEKRGLFTGGGGVKGPRSEADHS